MTRSDCSLSNGSMNPRCNHFGMVVRAWLKPSLLRMKSIPYGSICCPAHESNRIVGSRCQVLQLKLRQSIRRNVSMSTFSFSLSPPFKDPIFFPIMCRKSSELLMLEEDEAPDNVVKFLLLLEIASVDETDKLSLAIDSVDVPMFEDDTSKLLAGSLLPVLVDKLGEPARWLCDVTTFSFSFRYDVIKSCRKKNASASTVTKMWSSNSVMKLHSTSGFSSAKRKR